jgi:hypothetical protein
MELLSDALTRVLANCRVRMDKRKRKAGAGVEPSPGKNPRREEVARGELASAAGLEPACGEVEFRWPSSWPTRPDSLEAAE